MHTIQAVWLWFPQEESTHCAAKPLCELNQRLSSKTTCLLLTRLIPCRDGDCTDLTHLTNWDSSSPLRCFALAPQLGKLQTGDLTTIAKPAMQLVSHLPPILPGGSAPASGGVSLGWWRPLTAQLRAGHGDGCAVQLWDWVIQLQLRNSSWRLSTVISCHSSLCFSPWSSSRRLSQRGGWLSCKSTCLFAATWCTANLYWCWHAWSPKLPQF